MQFVQIGRRWLNLDLISEVAMAQDAKGELTCTVHFIARGGDKAVSRRFRGEEARQLQEFLQDHEAQ